MVTGADSPRSISSVSRDTSPQFVNAVRAATWAGQLGYVKDIQANPTTTADKVKIALPIIGTAALAVGSWKGAQTLETVKTALTARNGSDLTQTLHHMQSASPKEGAKKYAETEPTLDWDAHTNAIFDAMIKERKTVCVAQVLMTIGLTALLAGALVTGLVAFDHFHFVSQNAFDAGVGLMSGGAALVGVGALTYWLAHKRAQAEMADSITEIAGQAHINLGSKS